MSDLSLAELKALLAEAETSANSEYLEVGQPLFEQMIHTETVEQSKSGLSFGFSVAVNDIVVDGRKYSFRGYVTDVEQTDLRKELDKATKAAEKETEKIIAEAKRLEAMLIKAGHPVPENITAVLQAKASA